MKLFTFTLIAGSRDPSLCIVTESMADALAGVREYLCDNPHECEHSDFPNDYQVNIYRPGEVVTFDNE